MDFTIDSVINAINTANSNDVNLSPEERNEAALYIDQWAHSDEGPSQAMQILSDGNLDEKYKVYAAGVFRIQSSLIWGNEQFMKEESINLRDQFYDFFEKSELENGNRLFEMVLEILVVITLYEFPQEWELPSSFIFADISGIEDELLKSHYYHFIAIFLSAIDKSTDLITPDRIQYFRNLFLENCEFLYGHITACLSVENLVTDGLKIFNSFLQWASFDQVCNSTSLFHDLCFHYVFDNKTRKDSLECLKTVFTSRYDSSSFAPLSPLIIYALCNSTAVCENKQHITSDQDVLNFLLRLLTRFLPTILTIYGPDESSRTESIRNSMIESELGPDDLREAIVNILGVIVSIDESEYLTEEYWAFWITIFHNVLSEEKKDQDEFKPTLDFIRDYLPNIRESLYQCVPLDNIDDFNQNSGNIDPSAPYIPPQQSVFCTNRSRSAWSLLAKIDPEGTLEFLKMQESSIALCYAIANLEFCNKEQFDINLLSSELNELYEFANSSEPDPQLFIALLFCFSHTLTIDDNGQVFMNFIDFATKCVNEEEPPISTAGTNALFYALKKSESEFLNEQYVTDICDNCESYLLNLLQDDAVRMFKIASKLVSKMSSRDQIQNLYEKMAETLLSAMDSDYHLVTLFECIKESSIEADSFSNIFMGFIWQKLLEMTDRILHTNPPTEILEGCLDTVATALGKEPYDEDKTNLILSWLVEKVQSCIELGHIVDDAIYKFIGYIRSCFSDLNARLPDIISIFIEPVVGDELASYSSIMWMLSEFQFKLFDFEWFVPLAIESIRSFDKNDNINGLHCISLLINRANNKDLFTEAITNGAVPSLLTAVFYALTDTMHKETIQYYIRFIKLIMERGSKFGIANNQAFIQMFVEAIAESVQEPEEGLFVNFIGSLQNSINRPFKFSTMISDFLILIKKISPNDTEAFKFKKDDPNFSGDGGNVFRLGKNGQAKETVASREKHFRVVKEPDVKGF